MNNPSTSSSSSSSSSTTHLAPSTSTARPLKRTLDHLLSSEEPEFQSGPPPAKRVREHQMPDDHIDDHQMRDAADELANANAGKVEERPVVEGGAIESERENAKALKFLDEMEEELMCGCCSALLYHPVLISPCNHYFCGSCTVLWVRNGGTSCPACRQPSTSVTHSRLLEGFVDLLLRTYPEKQRPQAERDQADDVYSPTMNISIPAPKPANQDNILITQSRGHDPPPDNLARPCPHCLPNNEFGWRCPRPLADPTTDAEHAWNLDNGTPPGHAWCGSCDELHPLGAPSTTKCSVCETSFCGLSIPHLCVANGMSSAHLPVAVSNLTGMIQSLDVYDAFNGNTTEVELLFDWLREDGRGPRGILLSMIEKVRQSTGGFQALIDQGVFSHQPNDDAASDAPIPVLPPPPAPAAAVNEASAPVPEAEAEPQPQPQLDGNATDAAPAPAPPPPPPPPSFTRICRECCHELFFHRLYDWWAEERQAIVDAANAPPPPAPAAETQLEASLTAPPTEAAIAPPAGDPTAPPADALSDTDEDEDDDEDDEGESRPPSRSGGSRARVMLPEWATKPERRDCERGRACGDQHAPSHAREFNHVILVRPEPQPQPPAAGEREGEQATSTSTLPADAPVASGSPSAEAEADVEMVVVDGPAPPSSESSRVLKIEALLSNPAPTASTSTSSSSAVIKLDEDATMEDADSANVEHVLANVVASSSPPPAPVTGSSSVVVV